MCSSTVRTVARNPSLATVSDVWTVKTTAYARSATPRPSMTTSATTSSWSCTDLSRNQRRTPPACCKSWTPVCTHPSQWLCWRKTPRRNPLTRSLNRLERTLKIWHLLQCWDLCLCLWMLSLTMEELRTTKRLLGYNVKGWLLISSLWYFSTPACGSARILLNHSQEKKRLCCWS